MPEGFHDGKIFGLTLFLSSNARTVGRRLALGKTAAHQNPMDLISQRTFDQDTKAQGAMAGGFCGKTGDDAFCTPLFSSLVPAHEKRTGMGVPVDPVEPVLGLPGRNTRRVSGMLG